MELSKKSRLVRWTYFLADFQRRPPERTSLCAFFWRAFIWMPLFWLFVTSLVVGGISALSIASWQSRGIFPGILVIAFLVVYFNQNISRSFQNSWSKARQTVFIQGLKTVKGKVCPIIKITEDK